MSSSDRVILGENAIFSSDCEETGINNNLLVVAASGCGKTMSVSEALFLETKNSSLIATVTKRRIVYKYQNLFKRRGYRVEDLNFVNPSESTVSFDPLQYITSYQDITFLAESIVYANPKKNRPNNADPYWDSASASLLAAEIAYILMTKDNPSFNDVLELNDEINLDNYRENEKFKNLEAVVPNCFALSCWKSISQLPEKTAGCVFGTLNTTIDTIFTPELRKMFTLKDHLGFEQLASQKTILFVSSSAVNPALHCFVNLFYAQAFKSLFEYAQCFPSGKLPIPVRLLCDDFGTGSRVPNFAEYISIFREAQLSVTLLLQSESQLESMYGYDDAKTIINNCDTYLYMGGNDINTARSISERLNLPLEDVLWMPVGQEVIFRRGQRPIITKRYNIQQNTEYQKITAAYERAIAEEKERL